MKNKSRENIRKNLFSSRLSISVTTGDRHRISGKAYIGFTKRVKRIKPPEEERNKMEIFQTDVLKD